MKAELIFRDRLDLPDGTIIEMVIWRVPEAVPPSDHPFKYRLFFGRAGERIVGYDNERGKGDHKHVRDRETAYRFSGPEKLIADFIADVEKERGRDG